jgi:hypothetical protein
MAADPSVPIIDNCKTRVKSGLRLSCLSFAPGLAVGAMDQGNTLDGDR